MDRDDASARFWIDPVRLAYNLGFRASELRRIERIVATNATELLEAWREFHGT